MVRAVHFLPYTVKRLYFASHIFPEFRELALIREINVQRKLILRHAMGIFTYFVRPVHKMALYKYFKKVPSALPSANGSLSGSMPSEAISSPNSEMSGSVQQDTRQNSKTMNMNRGPHSSFSATKTSLPSSRVNPYPSAIGFHVVDDVETFNYEGMSAIPPVPTATSSYSFRENTYCEIKFCR